MQQKAEPADDVLEQVLEDERSATLQEFRERDEITPHD